MTAQVSGGGLESKLSDLVIEAKLETCFLDSSTQHIYRNNVGGEEVPTHRVENWKLDTKRPILGRGGFGVVRLERCQQSNCRMRAVKEIKKRDQNEAAMDYARELDALVQFSRPQYSNSFVQSLGWFESESSIFIAMEYLPRGDLGLYLQSPLPENEARQIISQVLEGIVYMHEKGFMHRDLKPGNIMVITKGPSWSVKIADFGISKKRFLQESLNTVGVGTIGYAAPEQIGLGSDLDPNNDEAPAPSFSADMWSIGILGVRLLTGNVPFKDLTSLSKYLSINYDERVSLLETSLEQNGASYFSKQFIVDLLQVEPYKRMGAYRASLHTWVAEPVGDFDDSSLPRIFVQDDDIQTRDFLSLDTDIESASWISVSSIQTDRLPFAEQASITTEKSATATIPLTGGGLRKYSSSESEHASRLRIAEGLLNKNLPKEASTSLILLMSQPTTLSTLSHEDQLALIRNCIQASVVTPSLIQKTSKFCRDNRELKTEMMASSLEVVQSLVEKGQHDKAVPLVRLMLENIDSIDQPSQRERLYPLVGSVIVNSSGFDKEAHQYTSQNNELKQVVSAKLAKKVDSLLEKKKFENAIRILERQDLDPSVSVATTGTGETETQYTDLGRRLQLAKAYMGQRKFQEVIKILELAIGHSNPEKSQLPFAHQCLAEAYTQIKSWTAAKSHAVESVNGFTDTLGPENRHTLAAIKTILDICKMSKDPKESYWKDMWLKSATNSLIKIQEEISSTEELSITARGFLECQQAMIEISARSPDKAASLGVHYLEENYITDEPICFDCIKAYLIEGACLFTAAATKFNCGEHKSKYYNFSVIHYLAASSPRAKGDGKSCFQELHLLLKFANNDWSVVNSQAQYAPFEPRSSSNVITISPFWLAALSGKSEFVDYILTVDTTDVSVGAYSLCSLPWLMRERGVSLEVVNTTVIRAIRALDVSTTSLLLRGSSIQEYCSWAWCFSSPDLLDVVLEKCREDPADLMVRSFEGDSKKSRETRINPMAVALADIDISSGSVPIERSAALATIIKFRAGGRSEMSLDGQRWRETFKDRVLPSQEPSSAMDHLAIRLSEALLQLSPTRWVTESLGLEEKRIIEIRNEIKTSAKIAHWILHKRGSVDKRTQSFWKEVEIRFNYLESGSFRRLLALGLSSEERKARRKLDVETSRGLIKYLQPIFDKIVIQ